MTDVVADISERALRLPAEQRAQLAEQLLASLAGEQDAAVDAAWDRELKQRIEEVERDLVRLSPADEVFARVRRALR